jgi:hypothetical protein
MAPIVPVEPPAEATGPRGTAAADTAEVDSAPAGTALLVAMLGASAADTADDVAAICDSVVDVDMPGRTTLTLPALAARRRGTIGVHLSGVLGVGRALRLQRRRRRYPLRAA